MSILEFSNFRHDVYQSYLDHIRVFLVLQHINLIIEIKNYKTLSIASISKITVGTLLQMMWFPWPISLQPMLAHSSFAYPLTSCSVGYYIQLWPYSYNIHEWASLQWFC